MYLRRSSTTNDQVDKGYLLIYRKRYQWILSYCDMQIDAYKRNRLSHLNSVEMSRHLFRIRCGLRVKSQITKISRCVWISSKYLA
jgi:hypothetical protein